MSHLGERAAALVDGELGHEQRERALAHLAGCATCRAEVDAQRRVKAIVREQLTPVPSPELVSRLLRLAEPGEPLPPERAAFPGDPRRAPVGWRTGAAAGPAPGRPAGTASGSTGPGRAPGRSSGRAGRVRRGVAVATGGVLTVAAATVSLALLGGTGAGPAPVTPPVEQLTTEHVRSTSDQPFVDPAVLLDGTETGLPAGVRAPGR